MKKIDNEKSKKTVIITSILFIIIGILYISFSYFTPSVLEENNYTTSGGADACLPNVTYSDLSNGITITNTIPMSDAEGLAGPSYDFSITNNETFAIEYEIYLQTESGNTIANNLVNTSINDSTPKTLTEYTTSDPDSGYSYKYKMITSNMLGGETKTFSLKVWLNEDGIVDTVKNKNWYGKIFIKVRCLEGIATETIKNIVAGEPTNTTDVITKTPGTNCTNTFAYDGTADNNLRYVGTNPCNYVTFNDETAGWRIMGIMNNVENGTGAKESRIKLIRSTSLGNYSWDSSSMGYGINDWSQADLMTELNGDYLNYDQTEITYWYNGRRNALNGLYNYSNSLKPNNQILIENAKWYLGATSETSYSGDSYTRERRANELWGYVTTKVCSDAACPRAKDWTGKIALIYPSDFGFATAGGTTTTRNQCISSVSLGTSNQDCIDNNWLAFGRYWVLNPYSGINNESHYVNYITSNRLYRISTYNAYSVYPTFYLSSSVLIESGNGSAENPYVFKK